MGNLRVSEWKRLPVSLTELCLDTTLRCGQSFRWKKLKDGEWSCALHGRILTLKQDSTHLHFRTIKPDVKFPTSSISSEQVTGNENDDTEDLLRHYFNLTPNLTALYEQWASVDSNFKKRAPKFTGVRILKQDAWEALVGFICSSNNNIVRISQMVNNICLHYGPLIGEIDGVPFHDFPQPKDLTEPGIEARLRELGFGYRAGYIAKTASIVARDKPEGWLQSLCNPEAGESATDQKPLPEGGRAGYRQAHEALLELQGVGPKVADCVSLMGLGWGEAVPIDTHVWQIAQRDYKFGKGKHRSLTRATYDAVGDYFRQLWGIEAGWAHSVLFAADLKTFSERVKTKVEVDVEEVKIKQEDGVLLESRVVIKKEIALGDVKDETADAEIKIGPSRSHRDKRRKMA